MYFYFKGGDRIMENLAFKIRLAVLWLIAEFIIFHVLLFLKPGVIEGIIAGEIEGMQIGPEMLLFFAILYLLPLVMAFLSLTLKDSVNRWANIILGAFFTGFSVLDIKDQLEDPHAFMMLLNIAAIVVTALIAWLAYKWPKKED